MTFTEDNDINDEVPIYKIVEDNYTNNYYKQFYER